MKAKKIDSDFPEAEAAKRRDEVLRGLLKTPPQQRPNASPKRKAKKPRASRASEGKP